MATHNLPEFPGFEAANKQAHKAIALLETAVHNLTRELDDEHDCAARAQRLRGASILATTAALELMSAAGWHEAVCAAIDAGLIA